MALGGTLIQGVSPEFIFSGAVSRIGSVAFPSLDFGPIE